MISLSEIGLSINRFLDFYTMEYSVFLFQGFVFWLNSNAAYKEGYDYEGYNDSGSDSDSDEFSSAVFGN